MESSFGETKTPNKTPRQRAVRKSALLNEGVEAPKRRIVRKSAVTDKVSESDLYNEVEARSTSAKVATSKLQRKAPTPISDDAFARKNSFKQKVVFFTLILVGIGASAAIGLTDSGQIDVLKTIEERNQRIRTNTADDRDTIISNVEVPVQNTSTNNSAEADGGLVGRGTGAQPPEIIPPVATSTASSSEATASSSEEVATTTDPGVESESSESIE
jgi:hypothetical protein